MNLNKILIPQKNIKNEIQNNILFILRHCNTTKDQHIIPSEYEQKLKILHAFINKVKQHHKNLKIKFIISPLERCIETCDLIKNFFEKKYKENYEVIIDEKLKRWDVGIESRENSYKRAFDYSKKFTYNNEICFIITHSSLIPRMVYGFIEKSMSFKDYEKKYMKKKLDHNSFAIVKNGELKKYNI